MIGSGQESIEVRSPRLLMRPFRMSDAEEVFACISPGVARFMTWEPPSWDEYRERCESRVRDADPNVISLVIRSLTTAECLGITAIEDLNVEHPVFGIWLKESVHGQGFGREITHAIARWACRSLDKSSLTYPVATQNTPSRRIAERLGGEIIGHRTGTKYDTVVYRVRCLP